MAEMDEPFSVAASLPPQEVLKSTVMPDAITPAGYPVPRTVTELKPASPALGLVEAASRTLAVPEPLAPGTSSRAASVIAAPRGRRLRHALQAAAMNILRRKPASPARPEKTSTNGSGSGTTGEVPVEVVSVATMYAKSPFERPLESVMVAVKVEST